MSITIPTTQQSINRNLANLESRLNQNSPLSTKAFLKVLAVVEGLNQTEQYKFAVERARQNLALTATAEDLDIIGQEYNVQRLQAEAAVIIFTLPALTGTLLPATRSYIGDSNGVRYIPDADVVAVAGMATITATAEDTGAAGNLNPGDNVTIGTPIAGAETTGTVTILDNTGAEQQSDDNYRQRVLDRIRSPGGGGNTADYRRFAQEVAGVARAYPFAGRPIGDPIVSQPPERTVYIESTVEIDSDGIPPASLITEARESIIADPITGIARQPLGLTNDTLFVVAITRLAFFVTVVNLTVDAGIESQVKTDISTALATYFRSLRPFVEGLDPEFDKNDIITDLTISDIVADVLTANNAAADGVGFSFSFLQANLGRFNLQQGETAKLGDVQFL